MTICVTSMPRYRGINRAILTLILRAAILPTLPMDIIKLIHFYAMRETRPCGLRTLMTYSPSIYMDRSVVNGNLICNDIAIEGGVYTLNRGIEVLCIDTGRCVFRAREKVRVTAYVLREVDGIFLHEIDKPFVTHITENDHVNIPNTECIYTIADLEHIIGCKYVIAWHNGMFLMIVINEALYMCCYWKTNLDKGVIFIGNYIPMNVAFVYAPLVSDSTAYRLFIWDLSKNNEPCLCNWQQHHKLIKLSKLSHLNNIGIHDALGCIEPAHSSEYSKSKLLPYNNGTFLVNHLQSVSVETGECAAAFVTYDLQYIGESKYGPCILDEKRRQICVWIY